MKLSDIKPIDNKRAWLLVSHFIDQILGGKKVDPALEDAVRHLYYNTKVNNITSEDQQKLNLVIQHAKNISNRQLDVYDELSRDSY